MTDKSLLFVYGTLRNGQPNNYILRDNGATFLQTCITVDKYIMITQNHPSFPYVFPVSHRVRYAHMATHIVGDLYEVNKTVLEHTDRLECHPSWYKRTEINIQLNEVARCKADIYLLTLQTLEIEDRYDWVRFIKSGNWFVLD